MSKPNFYGAYGKSRAGIYTSYQRLMNARRFIDGLKLKGFAFKSDAIQFVVDGLSRDYKTIEADEIDIELLKSKNNWNFEIRDLRKKIVIAAIIENE